MTDDSPAPDSETPPPTPRWVKVFVLVFVLLVLLVVGALPFGGGEHDPGRHAFGMSRGFALLTVLAVVVLLVEMRTISYFADLVANPTTSGDELRALPGTLVHSGGCLLVLLVLAGLNVYEPRVLTPYGWRKLREQRTESEP